MFAHAFFWYYASRASTGLSKRGARLTVVFLTFSVLAQGRGGLDYDALLWETLACHPEAELYVCVDDIAVRATGSAAPLTTLNHLHQVAHCMGLHFIANRNLHAVPAVRPQRHLVAGPAPHCQTSHTKLLEPRACPSHITPPPPFRRPNSAEFAALFCRIVGFLYFADSVCRFVGFLGFWNT